MDTIYKDYLYWTTDTANDDYISYYHDRYNCTVWQLLNQYSYKTLDDKS